MKSKIASGTVLHHRFAPPEHRFTYRLHMVMLELSELPALARLWRRPLCWFRREDYLGEGPLEQAVLARMNQLSETPLAGKVWLLGQVRTLGLYFSPVNFYLLEGESGFTHLLAEVSNTPWNQRHHYLVPLSGDNDHDKAFHVSPFMPMALQYQWRVKVEEARVAVMIRCMHPDGTPKFVADLRLDTEPLNRRSLWRVWSHIPAMAVKTVAGIYFEAMKLWWKGARFYPHPRGEKKQGDLR
ncbi:DUF1365 domain-containing protein [Ferrimonas balearica]|uniref:DUF1365 domain-containing protein n=1 Tax=Ferrimonas balearica TaxID=44012 RepID=UPI001C9994F0|nr:DUF1365 domain-containing protein [Ferrimonas balearica]MBY5992587.1 DUF1365 domain-containing protein [Ferrimonas balearica]